jgi:hypothetical protein
MATLQQQQAVYDTAKTALENGNVRNANHELQILRTTLLAGDPKPVGGPLIATRRLSGRMGQTVLKILNEIDPMLR